MRQKRPCLRIPKYVPFWLHHSREVLPFGDSAFMEVRVLAIKSHGARRRRIRKSDKNSGHWPENKSQCRIEPPVKAFLIQITGPVLASLG